MQRWEYLIVAMSRGEYRDSLGRKGQLPTRFHGSGSSGDPTGLMNELGEQGWELSGVAGSYEPDVYQLFLKRPKP